MELIDKQKLLEWAKKEFYAAKERNDEGAMLAYQNLKYAVDTNEIESVTFDDHSAQEEISELRRIAKQCGDYAEQRNKMHARAIQAEQERDKYIEGNRIRQRLLDQADEERNALLELVQELANGLCGPDTFRRARSIIAKLEGSKPLD